jgi:hypothetical protein
MAGKIRKMAVASRKTMDIGRLTKTPKSPWEIIRD